MEGRVYLCEGRREKIEVGRGGSVPLIREKERLLILLRGGGQTKERIFFPMPESFLFPGEEKKGGKNLERKRAVRPRKMAHYKTRPVLRTASTRKKKGGKKKKKEKKKRECHFPVEEESF